MDSSAIVLLGTAIVAVGAFATWKYFERRKFAALPEHVQAALTQAKALRKTYKNAAKDYRRRTAGATSALQAIRDPKGRRLKALGGATLYERWIDTPQGNGSIIGVKATAADESSIKQRLTATRLVTFGVFALAAPKSSTAGNAYVVIDGPEVAGVATISAKSNANAGPAAFAFAASINNAARAAEAAEPGRPKAIEAARLALERARDDSDVVEAKAKYVAAIEALPQEHQAQFTVG